MLNDKQIIIEEFTKLVNKLELTKEIEQVGLWVALLCEIYDYQDM